MMTWILLVYTYLLEKINKTIHFSIRNTCLKHKFGNFTYEYYLKDELSIFGHSFQNCYSIIYTEVMINSFSIYYNFIFKHYIVKI